MIVAPLSGRDPRAGDLLDRLNAQIARMRETQPFWAGLPAAPLNSLADLARLPVLRKSDLVDLQSQDAPFGGLTGGPVAGLRRLFVSPGPIFDPEGRGADWWGSSAALSAAPWGACCTRSSR